MPYKTMTTGQQRIADILCYRDDITQDEACELIAECLEAMEACGYESNECEELMSDILGLECDYVFDLLGF